MNAKLVIMDEPTSSLSNDEVRELFRIIRRLRSQGVAVVYITHRMEEIFELADRVTVLRDGKVIGTKDIGELTRDSLITMMVGRELSNIFPKVKAQIGGPVLEVRGLCRRGVFEDISFQVHKGEILGLSGLVGAGRTEIVRSIFGLDPLDAGKIFIDGKPVKIKTPQQAIGYGIAMVSEDRKNTGLVLCRSLLENIALPNLRQFSTGPLIHKKKEAASCREIAKKLSTKCSSLNQPAQSLSGGNQQKVVISKWLLTGAKIMILDEPTRGIDVGAKSEIHRIMSELASQGMAVIMISSEMPEIVSMSDRILVVGGGRIKGEFQMEEGNSREALQQEILTCALGGN